MGFRLSSFVRRAAKRFQSTELKHAVASRKEGRVRFTAIDSQDHDAAAGRYFRGKKKKKFTGSLKKLIGSSASSAASAAGFRPSAAYRAPTYLGAINSDIVETDGVLFTYAPEFVRMSKAATRLRWGGGGGGMWIVESKIHFRPMSLERSTVFSGNSMRLGAMNKHIESRHTHQ